VADTENDQHGYAQEATRQRDVGTPWRDDPEVMARLVETERLHVRGLSNYAIARELGVSEGTIRNDLGRIQTLWAERVGDDIIALRARVVAELDAVRLRALQAAEFDNDAERAILLDTPLVDADGTPRKIVSRGRNGVHFNGSKASALAVARQATLDKAKILGLLVDKIAPTTPDGQESYVDALMARYAARCGLELHPNQETQRCEHGPPYVATQSFN